MVQNLRQYSLGELKELVKGLGLEEYRAEQIFKWIWQRGVRDFEEMTDISKEWRAYFKHHYSIEGLALTGLKQEGGEARKYLIRLEDGEKIESVFIRENRRRTVCVSCQVGCPLGCKFCATAALGWKRDLLSHEIAGQVQLIQKTHGEKFTNIVFMGMGEPLLNIDEVFRTLDIMNSSIGFAIGRRHTTISTAGVVDGMERLLDSSYRVKMAISLNFADDDLRREFMPVARNNPLSEILRLARAYSRQKEMVTFEYVMIRDVNDSMQDARNLIRLLRGISSKVNLIPLNEYPGIPYRRPTERKIDEFHRQLLESNHTVVIRKSRGQKILAGCGQLAGTTDESHA